jgi:hypothetical protein
MTSTERGAGSRLRRFAERTFEPQTLERVILPALADLEFECAGDADASRLVRWRAYWGLWKAIALCLLTDWSRNGRPLAEGVATRMTVIFPIVIGVVMVPALNAAYARPLVPGPFLLMSLAQAFVFALPIAFFFAVALERHLRSPRQLLPAVFAMALACTLLTMTVTLSVVPRANQAYRQAAYERLKAPADPALDSSGSGELTFTELVRRARSGTPERERSAARHALGMRLATSTLPIVLGFLALGIAGYPWTHSLFLGMWVLMFYVAGLRAAAVSPFQGPSVRGIWVVNAAFVLVGLSMVWSRPSPTDAEPKGYIIS